MIELNWEQAEVWQKIANVDKCDSEPTWRWDCGFKLDYDGSLLRISSRFYPNGLRVNPSFDGTVSIYRKEHKILSKEFNCSNLEQLKIEVEAYVKNIEKWIESLIISNLSNIPL